ncbi:MAG TPA: gamma-glutamylcyclotransferase family protein [Pseudonocardiaceae bacterium]
MFSDADYPADPYPGARPDVSFVHLDGHGSALRSPRQALSTGIPVLAYGSNACPSKITWLRHELGLAGPVTVLRAHCTGLSAVWAAALRVRDGQRPATLAAAPGRRETHAVWLATPDQVEVLDRCEGRGERYRLARLRTGEIRTEDGVLLPDIYAYVGASEIRMPLLVDGAPVPCAEVAQADAIGLIGEPGPDGLDATTVTGAPRVDDWPATVFVYGTLQPTGAAWDIAAPWCVSEPTKAELTGALYDTGLGWPALRLTGTDPVPGYLLTLRSPAEAFAVLDEYEGGEYRRVRAVLAEDAVCWTYEWTAPVAGMVALPRGW